jgi:superfamily I DNA/RNA helicase
VEVIRRAEKSGRFVLSTPEYVGGLEFDAVILVGVDKGRVPPVRDVENLDSANFLTYAAHNRLYVAISRAKYRVFILGLSERGLSTLLQNAVASDGLSLDVGR